MLRIFENYQRQLWPVIAALARRGFAVPPDEARDLIQDFYVDEWQRFSENYDPARGSFERYLFGAFFQFARRRIARDYSQKKRMTELSTIVNLSDGAPPLEEVLDENARANQMREALAQLQSHHREALESFLQDSSANERTVARQMGITRYRLRETLTDAVGRLATQLHSLEPKNDIEQNVADALWRDGLDARETADLLGVLVSDVHVIRKRIVNHLLSALHTSTRKTSRSENMFRADLNSNRDPLGLLKRVLSSRDPQLLQQLRIRAGEVVAALDADDEDFTDAEGEVLAEDLQWLAQVYDVLGSDDDAEMDTEEAEIEAVIDDIHGQQEREIVQAFNMLTTYLPHHLSDWGKWFGELREVDHDTRLSLSRRWSELGAGDSIEQLTRYGLTPATFFEATIGLQLLLERCIADSTAGISSVVLLEFGSGVAQRPTDPRYVTVSRDQLLAQMRSSPDCPPRADKPLLQWTCSAAAFRRRLFEGFQVFGSTGSVLAVILDPANRSGDLLYRWSYNSSRRSTARAPTYQLPEM